MKTKSTKRTVYLDIEILHHHIKPPEMFVINYYTFLDSSQKAKW